MLCDEPGLGKTITMLALILLSRGESTSNMPARVDPPRGSASGRQLRPRDRSLCSEDLVSSAASLVVVPDAYIEHWAEQIEAHVTPSLLKTFVDKGEGLPSSSELAKYDVVITSFSRMAKEWQHHRPPSTLEARQIQRYGFEDQPARYLDGRIQGTVSPLHLVHWLRVVVDEGHKLGDRAPTHLMLMARLLCAERRWVMTGTPSPNTLQAADLQYLHGLLLFLRNLPYGNPDGLAWNKAIATPFAKNQLVGFFRLQHLLRRIMVRHTKAAIGEGLPSPIFRKVYIDPTPSELSFYNGVVAEVQANLCITGIDPRNPGKMNQLSLLNPRNHRNAAQVEENLRIASTGGFYKEFTTRPSQRNSTLEKLREYGVNADRVKTVTEYLDTVAPRRTTRCESCDRLCRTLMVLPSAHLFCASCVENWKRQIGCPWCFLCNQPFNEDEFNYQQPTLTDELTAKGRKHTLETLYFSGVDDVKMAHVLQYLDAIETKSQTECLSCHRNLNLLMIMPCGDLSCPDCVWRRFQKDGPNCCICREPFDRDKFVCLQPNTAFRAIAEDKAVRKWKHSTGITAKRVSPTPKRSVDFKRDFWQVESSKIFYIAARIRELTEEFARLGDRPVKAIVFSQSRESIWRVKLSLNQQDISTGDFIALKKAKERVEHLAKFKSDSNLNVLLLSDLGSHGLDLSFVTHIFLFEEIWDKSLEQQVICRAHRIGATDSVVVEQLWMQGSVECESMNWLGREGSAADENELTRDEVQESSTKDKTSFFQVRMHYILTNLQLLDEAIAGKNGEVRFTVFDEGDVIIRQGVRTILDSGEITTTSTMPNPLPEPDAPASTPEAPVLDVNTVRTMAAIDDGSPASDTESEGEIADEGDAIPSTHETSDARERAIYIV